MVKAKHETRDDAFVERIAKLAVADKRSVVRVLAGLPVRGRAGERIRAILEKEDSR
jgi:hypothetical protein